MYIHYLSAHAGIGNVPFFINEKRGYKDFKIAAHKSGRLSFLGGTAIADGCTNNLFILFFYYTIIHTVSTIKKKNLVANDYPNDYLCLKLKY